MVFRNESGCALAACRRQHSRPQAAAQNVFHHKHATRSPFAHASARGAAQAVCLGRRCGLTRRPRGASAKYFGGTAASLTRNSRVAGWSREPVFADGVMKLNFPFPSRASGDPENRPFGRARARARLSLLPAVWFLETTAWVRASAVHGSPAGQSQGSPPIQDLGSNRRSRKYSLTGRLSESAGTVGSSSITFWMGTSCERIALNCFTGDG